MCLLCISFPQRLAVYVTINSGKKYPNWVSWMVGWNTIGFGLQTHPVHGCLQIIPLWVLWEQMVWSWIPTWIHLIEGPMEREFISMAISLVLLLLFSCQALSDSLWPHGLQYARPPCPSPSPRICPSSCPLNWWCHLIISSSLAFFFCLQFFPASRSFPMSQLFASDGQSIGASASASVLPINI